VSLVKQYDDGYHCYWAGTLDKIGCMPKVTAKKIEEQIKY
jgi:hypothetical protein